MLDMMAQGSADQKQGKREENSKFNNLRLLSLRGKSWYLYFPTGIECSKSPTAAVTVQLRPHHCWLRSLDAKSVTVRRSTTQAHTGALWSLKKDIHAQLWILSGL